MQNFYEKVKLRHVQISAVMFVLFMGLSVVYAMGHVSKAVGMQVLDLMASGYSYDYVIEFMKNMSEETHHFYAYVQLPVDMFLALFLGVFPAVSMAYIGKVIRVHVLFIAVALSISILDFLENFMVFRILGGNLSKDLVSAASGITIAKNIALITTLISLIIFTVLYHVKKRGSLMEPHPNVNE